MIKDWGLTTRINTKEIQMQYKTIHYWDLKIVVK